MRRAQRTNLIAFGVAALGILGVCTFVFFGTRTESNTIERPHSADNTRTPDSQPKSDDDFYDLHQSGSGIHYVNMRKNGQTQALVYMPRQDIRSPRLTAFMLTSLKVVKANDGDLEASGESFGQWMIKELDFTDMINGGASWTEGKSVHAFIFLAPIEQYVVVVVRPKSYALPERQPQSVEEVGLRL